MPTKTLAQKLYIRPGYTVALLDPPKGVSALLEPLPEDVIIVNSLDKKADLVLIFVKTSAELEKAAKQVSDSIGTDVILWFAYPKKTGKVATDLTRDQGWKSIYEMGFQGVASVAIDDTWTGLRFKRVTSAKSQDAIAELFADRADFRPIYDQLFSIIINMGQDIELVMRQSYVAFSRGRQFALIKPANDRLDLAMRLTVAPLGSRLESAAGFGSGSMTHKVRMTKIEDIDREVIGWLQDAYRLAAK